MRCKQAGNDCQGFLPVSHLLTREIPEVGCFHFLQGPGLGGWGQAFGVLLVHSLTWPRSISWKTFQITATIGELSRFADRGGRLSRSGFASVLPADGIQLTLAFLCIACLPPKNRRGISGGWTFTLV